MVVVEDSNTSINCSLAHRHCVLLRKLLLFVSRRLYRGKLFEQQLDGSVVRWEEIAHDSIFTCTIIQQCAIRNLKSRTNRRVIVGLSFLLHERDAQMS